MVLGIGIAILSAAGDGATIDTATWTTDDRTPEVSQHEKARQMARTLVALAVVWLAVLAWPTRRHWCQGWVEDNVGVAYAKGLLVAEDRVAALGWYERAAAHGSPAAAFNLGFAHQSVLGTPADAEVAAHWYEQAARSGLAEAGNNLAMDRMRRI